MVKLALLALVLLTTAVHAEAIDPGYVEEEIASEPAFNMFGFRMTGGALPIDGNRVMALSVGLGVEHPVFKKTRMFGEYEWLWLTHADERAMDSVVNRPERHGTGHRASFGLRRELVGKRLGRSIRLFLDAELGVTAALVNDNMSGVAFLPAGLGGLRFGYDIYSDRDNSPSRTFELEFLFRAIALDGGAGGLMGFGMLWGN